MSMHTLFGYTPYKNGSVRAVDSSDLHLFFTAAFVPSLFASTFNSQCIEIWSSAETESEIALDRAQHTHQRKQKIPTRKQKHFVFGVYHCYVFSRAHLLFVFWQAYAIFFMHWLFERCNFRIFYVHNHFRYILFRFAAAVVVASSMRNHLYTLCQPKSKKTHWRTKRKII